MEEATIWGLYSGKTQGNTIAAVRDYIAPVFDRETSPEQYPRRANDGFLYKASPLHQGGGRNGALGYIRQGGFLSLY